MDATAPSTSSPVAPPDSAASWRALAGSGVLAMFGVSALYGSTFGLFLLPLQQSLGWSRGDRHANGDQQACCDTMHEIHFLLLNERPAHVARAARDGNFTDSRRRPQSGP